jgi:hypothetical protein
LRDDVSDEGRRGLGAALLAVIGLGVATEAAVGVGATERPALALEIDQYAVNLMAGSRLSGGTDLKLVVQRAGVFATTIGLSDTFPSLSSIGTPETDSLAGLSPISTAAFTSEFHLPTPPTRGH